MGTNVELVAVAAVVATAGVVTLGIVAATPAHQLPVGTAMTNGDSMGHDQPRFIVYADVQPDVGDSVVVELEEGSYLNHRIVGETEAGYVTQGDAEPRPDQDEGRAPYASDGSVRGVVVASTSTTVLQGSLVVLPALLGLVGAWYRRRRTRVGDSVSIRPP